MRILEVKQPAESGRNNLYEWMAAGESTVVTCELTLAELRFLRRFMGNISGGPDTTARRWANSIWVELHDNPLVNHGCPTHKHGAVPRLFSEVTSNGNLVAKNINYEIDR